MKEDPTSSIRVEQKLQAVNVSPTSISPELKQRIILLDKHTPTLDDEVRAILYASKVFEYAKNHAHPYSEVEQKAVVLGTLFTDIGKSGPKGATREQSELVVSIYSQENIPQEDVEGSLKDFLMKYFKNQGPQIKVDIFESLNIDPEATTMRDFYDLHTQWTFDILSVSNLPQEVIPVASCHHRLRGDNPHSIIREDDSYVKSFGSISKYGRSEKLVGLLDQYDAFRRRSGLAHQEAIDKLKETINLARGGHYKEDQEFQEIIADIDLSLNPQS